MAVGTRTIRVRFDGTTTGLNRAAGQAAGAIDKFVRRTQLAAGAMVAAGAVAPALLAGATLLFAGLAAAGLASSEKVKGAFTKMGREVKAGLTQDAAVLEKTAIRVAQKLGTAFESVRPILRQTFAAIGPQIETLTDGVTRLITNALPGLSRAAMAAGNAVSGLADFLAKTGKGVSDFFDQIATAGPNAGKVWSELGTLIGNLLPVLGKLLAVASDFASGALPVLNAAIGGLLDILAGVLDFLQPIAPVLGGVAAAALTTVAAFKGFALLATLVRTFGAATMLAGLHAGTFVSRMGFGAVAGARFATVVTSVARSLPLVGIAAAAAAFAWDELTVSADDAAAALNQGGEAAAAAMQQLATQGAVVRGLKEDWFGLGDLGKMLGGVFDTLTTSSEEFKAGLSGVGLAQAEAAEALAAYNVAVQQFGETSPQAAAAQERLGLATDRVKVAQEGAANATKSHQQALQELADFMAGQIDASLQYEQAVNSAAEAERAAAAAVREHGANSQQAKDANFALQQEYARVAQAARAKAEADNAASGETAAAAAGADAYRMRLVVLASQQNGPGRSAALGLIDRLNDSELAALNAATETAGFATTVQRLPSGREVKVAVETAAAERALTELARTRTVVYRTVAQQTSHIKQGGKGLSTGGAIHGPGTSTSDTAGLYALSNGEHVWTAAEVRRAGGHAAMERMRAGYRSGGPPVSGADGAALAPAAGGVNVTVMIDGQEFRGMVRTEIDEDNRRTRRSVGAGSGRGF